MPEIDEKGNKKKSFSIISIVIFMAALVLPSILWLFVHLAGKEAVAVLDYDLGENRNKASFPDTFSSSFMGEIEEYYNDRLPFRSVIISANRKLTSMIERPYDRMVEKGDDLPPRVHNDATIEGREKWLFFAKENSLEDYLGSNILSIEQMESYLTGMKELQEVCETRGKQVFFMIPPNKEQVYSEFMPSYTIEDPYKKAQRLVDYIQENSDIKIIYPMKELKAAKDKWQLYLKTDTHWNSAGAFIGVQALYALMGLPTTELESLTVLEEPVYNGDLLTMGNLDWEDYVGDKTYTVYYRLDVEVTEELGNGTGAGADIYSTTASSANPCNFVMLGDSFRINMGPYLSKDFDRCTLINIFNAGEADARNAVENADIIVVELVERNSINFPNIMSAVCEILEQ